MSRFENKTLDNYDVMEHIKNIYSIIGTTGKTSVETPTSKNIVERLQELQTANMIDWMGTQEQYNVAKASGLITETMVCAITDDFYQPET